MDPSRRQLKALVLGAAALYLVISLFPFRIDAPRRVDNAAVIGPAGELVLTDTGIATSLEPPPWLDAVARGAPFQLELDVRPARTDQEGPARILTIARDYRTWDLVIGQQGSSLIVRSTSPAGPGRHAIDEVFTGEAWSHIDLRIHGGRLTVAVDGRTRLERTFTGPPSWDPGYRLAFGNEIIGGRPWLGTIDRAVVMVGGRRFDLLQPGDLTTPAGWWELPDRLREPPHGLSVAGTVGWAFHAVSSLILGGLLLAVLGGRVREALTVGWVLACAVQLAKVFVAGRHPSLVDLAIAFAGTAVGAAVAVRLGRNSRVLGTPVTVAGPTSPLTE